MTTGAVGAWTALVLALLAAASGLPLPPRGVELLALTTLAVSIAMAVRTLLGAWRGPIIASFPRRDAVICEPPGAEAIRERAQLRGTMGGAGHVRPALLALPATAWAAASVAAAMVLRDPSLATAPPWPLAVLGAAAGAAVVLPAQPFFYREVTGGRVLVFPPEACTRLLERAAGEGLLRAPDPVGASPAATAGWVSSRNPVESRGNSPHGDEARPS